MAATLKIYDPLKAVKRMEKAGVKKELAESIAGEIRESQDIIVNDLATKQDLLITKNELKAEINSLRSVKKDLIIKLGTLMATGVGIIAVLIKF
jgi:hypothetical protein